MHCAVTSNIPEGKGKCVPDTKQPDNIGEVDTSLSGQDPQVREGTLYHHRAAEGVSHRKLLFFTCVQYRKHEYGAVSQRPWEGGIRVVIFTVDRYGKPGMPTFNIRKVRKLLKAGKAEIFCYAPFTVKLLYAERLDVQPVELCQDTGDRHIGVSVKSEKHEFVHAQYDPLPDEKERHDDRRRYRRTRRGRLRYRKPRFDNRRKPEGYLAPSLENKKSLHVSIAKRYIRVCPVTEIHVEAGTFDTQALEAIQRGLPLPEGTDYQRGPRYRMNTLRDAVFYRDGYKCLLCGEEGKILRVHHVGYWKGDHSDRMGNLASICTDCHIPPNHKPGGKLYGWKPKIMPVAGAAFMNAVRRRIVDDLKEETGLPVYMTYGSATKTARHALCIAKTHANDAFVMGSFHPKHRHREEVFQKRRRNNRILEKFYDAISVTERRNPARNFPAEDRGAAKAGIPQKTCVSSGEKRSPKAAGRYGGSDTASGLEQCFCTKAQRPAPKVFTVTARG